MRLINILSCAVLLLPAAGAAIPADRAGEPSVTQSAAQVLHGQDMQKNAPSTEQKQEPSTTLYQVMGVVLFIWIGLAVFLFRLDRRVARLENRAQPKQ
ncbi:MAG TPA: CcmD family protein [Spirochaetota bacterium]|nr:CcmD family protein [Spirochaetota bacterium]HPC39348.1 CcmD family protein [Spirochaetota bacterium]HPL15155.1 CcmD family protein [Spirochaetota bacterium]HQF08714.1 CcmD family protein [Spirochaetota bacterium]HQH97585.1 CcmD family protein [Spirochaetota bacterium]